MPYNYEIDDDLWKYIKIAARAIHINPDALIRRVLFRAVRPHVARAVARRKKQRPSLPIEKKVLRTIARRKKVQEARALKEASIERLVRQRACTTELTGRRWQSMTFEQRSKIAEKYGLTLDKNYEGLRYIDPSQE